MVVHRMPYSGVSPLPRGDQFRMLVVGPSHLQMVPHLQG